MSDAPSALPILQRRVRGHLPVSRFAVADDGFVTLAVPDPDRPRAYELGSLSPAGEWQAVGGFSVETPVCWDLSEAADVVLAATDDCLYAFRAGQKSRLLADRRDVFLGASLSASGAEAAVASTDMLQSAYALTLALTDGSAGWTLDIQGDVSRVLISPDGSLLLYGTEQGLVSLHGADRRLLWQFDSGLKVTALSLPAEGRCALFGTQSGLAVMLEDGEKRWGLQGAGEVTALSASADASKIAAARDDGEGDWPVECVSHSGEVFQTFRAPARVLSAAWSKSGRYLAVSCADGSLLLIEMEASLARHADPKRAAEFLSSARGLIHDGRPVEAAEALQTVLRLDPSSVEAASLLAEARAGVVRDSVRLARESLEEGDLPGAVRLLDEAWGGARVVPAAAPELMEARKQASARMLDLARGMLESGSPDDALDALGSLLELDPCSAEARGLLAEAEGLAAEVLARGAEEASASGALAEAVRLWEQVWARRPSDEVRAKLSEARRDAALARGMELYAEKRYAQAVFQFRRVLSLDPANAEALKHLEYAQNLAGDDSLLDRFRLLE